MGSAARATKLLRQTAPRADGRPPRGPAADARAAGQGMIWLILVSQLPRTPRVIPHLGSAAYC